MCRVCRVQAKQVVGYVLQHDHLLPHLTVRETLQYAGYLRLPSSIPHKKKKLIVSCSPLISPQRPAFAL